MMDLDWIVHLAVLNTAGIGERVSGVPLSEGTVEDDYIRKFLDCMQP